MKILSTEEKLKEVMKKETKKFAEKETPLSGVLEKFEEMGIDTRTTYKLPLKDTIGKTREAQARAKRLWSC